MSKPKHTPGPWRYEAERFSAKHVIGVDGDDRWIAHCQPEFNGEANAVLISAAPEMLSALYASRAAIQTALEAKPSHWELTNALEVVMGAIAKAEGREK